MEIKDSLKWVIENPILEDELSNGDLVKINNSCDLSVSECECLLNYITQLEQENQKYKEVIDKLNKYLHTRAIKKCYNGKVYSGFDGLQAQVFEDILKEVE